MASRLEPFQRAATPGGARLCHWAGAGAGARNGGVLGRAKELMTERLQRRLMDDKEVATKRA